MKPIIGIVMGDASGVGPEVTVKALASGAWRNGIPLIIGDRRTLDAAQKYVGIRLDPFPENKAGALHESPSFLELHNLSPQVYALGKPSVAAAGAAIEALLPGLALLKEGRIHALVFGPLDKKAYVKRAAIMRTSTKCSPSISVYRGKEMPSIFSMACGPAG